MTNKTPDGHEPTRWGYQVPTASRPKPAQVPNLSDGMIAYERKLRELMKMAGFASVGMPEETLAVMYLDNEAAYEEVRDALETTLAAFDRQIIMASDPVIGSIWQAFVTSFKKQTTPEGIDDAAGILKAGAQARWLGEPQSQITKAQGEAIASLLSSLESTQNALLTFSNLLIVKVDGVPVVLELTPEQVEHLQKNPLLYTDPRKALGVLERVSVAAASGHKTDGGMTIAP